MKKKNLTKVIVTVFAAVILTASGMAATGGWIKVSDNCGKWKITDTEYTCGKCGSGMSTSWKWDDENKPQYMIYTFKCKDRNKKGCTHSCVYKTKP